MQKTFNRQPAQLSPAQVLIMPCYLRLSIGICAKYDIIRRRNAGTWKKGCAAVRHARVARSGATAARCWGT